MTTVLIRRYFIACLILMAWGTLPLLAQSARVQVIHNAPYTEIDTVDIYINGVLQLDDFTFRSATPFGHWAAEVNLAVDITAPDAADHTNPIATDTLRLEANQSYIIIAAGDPLERDGQPGFDLFTYDQALEAPTIAGTVQVLSFHGAPDISRYEVVLRGGGAVEGALDFGDFGNGYDDGGSGSRWDIDLQTPDEMLLLPMVWDVREVSNQVSVNMASGFKDPEQAPAPDAPRLEVVSVWADGSTTIAPQNVANVQFIHNMPLAEVDTIDVYRDGMLWMDNVPFRSASAFTEWVSGVKELPSYRIDITAADNSEPLYSKTLSIHYDITHILALMSHPFAQTGSADMNLYIYARIQSQGLPGDDEVLVVHGSPQGGEVDVKMKMTGTESEAIMAENLSYGGFAPYKLADGLPDSIFVRHAGEARNLAVFELDANMMASASAMMLSGYLEQGGDFQLAMVPVAGGALVEAETVSGVATAPIDEQPAAFVLHGNYPNPFNPTTTLHFDLPTTAEVQGAVYDVLGRQVLSIPSRVVTAGYARTVRLDATSLASGLYVYRLSATMAHQTLTATGSLLLSK